jgi:Uma2 family endonuclease
MSASTLPRMTADEFIAWALEQPEGERYELFNGRIVAMAPERLAHARAKGHVFRRLGDAIAAALLPCEAVIDGVAVQVDDTTIYEPDVLVRCGPRLPGETLRIVDPLIVVEVLSPSSRSRDAGLKLADYFRISSLRHYLIVATDTRTVIHHARDEAGAILTRIIRDGMVRLDPPGLHLDNIFPDEPEP